MRVLLTAALLAGQGSAEISPAFRKFERIQLGLTLTTAVKSSNGRDSKVTARLEVTAEVESSEGSTAVFDCGLTALVLEGLLDGRKVDLEWRKGGAVRGEPPSALSRALEKGWKMRLDGAGGIRAGEGFREVGDVLTLLNPAVLIGFPVPPSYSTLKLGKGWEVKPVDFKHLGGYAVRYGAGLDFVEGDVARLSAKLVFSPAQAEAELEGAASVKGEGFASMEYDVKKGRPVRGASSAKVLAVQGGFRREIEQVLEFQVR